MSIYALTGDEVSSVAERRRMRRRRSRFKYVGYSYCPQIFKQRAVELANKLLPAFKTSNGVPLSFLDLKT